nr:hypothetical protein SFHH103_04254 [Sinorhizobium fredii HH103]
MILNLQANPIGSARFRWPLYDVSLDPSPVDTGQQKICSALKCTFV